MARVIHFEINADQPERAIKFYSDVFGWKIQKWEGPQEYGSSPPAKKISQASTGD